MKDVYASRRGRRVPRLGWIRDDGVGCIPLTKGLVALVDAEDVPALSEYNWNAMRITGRDLVYAVRKEMVHRVSTTHLMHRVITECPRGLEVDHVDRDGLNNQRANIRMCSSSQNKGNVGVRRNSTSGLIGVGFHKREQQWRAHIGVSGKHKHLGFFSTKEAAATARDIAALEVFGEFAVLNFPRTQAAA